MTSDTQAALITVERHSCAPVQLARQRALPALVVLLLGTLGLRLWGITQGLPYAYNADENAHFLPRAIGMFGHTLNPEYFANPPAFTYLLHLLLAVRYGSGAAVGHAYAADPTAVWVLARAAVAVLGTLAVWLLYLAGARLFGRGVALLAAALEAVAFLPVFYAHLALNDVPTLAALTLSLVGSAGILRRGKPIDYVVAGIGLGLGCATKYTAGIVILVLIAACACRFLEPQPGAGRRAVIGLVGALGCALVAFIAANPYSILDFSAFHSGIAHQSNVSQEAQGKLGAPAESGFIYYLWAFTWGFGWMPALAAFGGALTIWRSQRRLGWLLVPAPVLYLAFMGVQHRYFGRWLLPILPILSLLAAHFIFTVADSIVRLGSRVRTDRSSPSWRARRAGAVALLSVAACLQGLIYSIHSDLVLSRPYTMNSARSWMLAHIPPGSRIVLEPIAPADWVLIRPSAAHPATSQPWLKYSSLRSVIAADGTLTPQESSIVNIEDYERTLSPALIGYYESERYCWVISGATQFGRAQADPQAVPHAIAYYRKLSEQGTLVYHRSPYRSGSPPVAFNFDWTFDFYPLAYRLPGPEVNIYRLRGGRCANS